MFSKKREVIKMVKQSLRMEFDEKDFEYIKKEKENSRYSWSNFIYMCVKYYVKHHK